MQGPIYGIGQGTVAAPGARPLHQAGAPSLPGESSTGASFSATLKEALNQVSGLQENAQDAISAYLRGDPVEVHRVMAAAEEAGIALEMLVEVRNKVTEAYRTVISMQS
jgi:flagellar hook-basal body complex protein FliE